MSPTNGSDNAVPSQDGQPVRPAPLASVCPQKGKHGERHEKAHQSHMVVVGVHEEHDSDTCDCAPGERQQEAILRRSWPGHRLTRAREPGY